MDNQKGTAGTAGRKKSSLDPVKSQGILAELNKKERHASKLWPQKWRFLKDLQKIQEEEALKLGISAEEYKKAIKERNCQLEPKQYPVTVDPSPKPFPKTTTGTIGHRALCPLERYGRLVKTGRDYPTRPPLPPGQVYDPYKQTIIFLGIDVGDPTSYKLPPSQCEVTDQDWAQPQQMDVTPFNFDIYSL